MLKNENVGTIRRKTRTALSEVERQWQIITTCNWRGPKYAYGSFRTALKVSLTTLRIIACINVRVFFEHTVGYFRCMANNTHHCKRWSDGATFTTVRKQVSNRLWDYCVTSIAISSTERKLKLFYGNPSEKTSECTNYRTIWCALLLGTGV